jgi:hypothetical protein
MKIEPRSMNFGHNTAAFDSRTVPYVNREMLVAETDL